MFQYKPHEYEYSELVLYEVTILLESGRQAEALKFLEEHDKQITDRTFVKETNGKDPSIRVHCLCVCVVYKYWTLHCMRPGIRTIEYRTHVCQGNQWYGPVCCIQVSAYIPNTAVCA